MVQIKDSQKIKNLMLKVQALADKGDSGERIAAQEKLKVLMKKYNIKKFEESKIKKRTFKLSNFDDCKTVMVHCILDSLPSCKIEGSLQGKKLYASMTDGQYIQTLEKFNYYYPQYIKQRDSFLVAFILKNNLGISDTQESPETDVSIDDVVGFMDIIDTIPYGKEKKLLERE